MWICNSCGQVNEYNGPCEGCGTWTREGKRLEGLRRGAPVPSTYDAEAEERKERRRRIATFIRLPATGVAGFLGWQYGSGLPDMGMSRTVLQVACAGLAALVIFVVTWIVAAVFRAV